MTPLGAADIGDRIVNAPGGSLLAGGAVHGDAGAHVGHFDPQRLRHGDEVWHARALDLTGEHLPDLPLADAGLLRERGDGEASQVHQVAQGSVHAANRVAERAGRFHKRPLDKGPQRADNDRSESTPAAAIPGRATAAEASATPEQDHAMSNQTPSPADAQAPIDLMAELERARFTPGSQVHAAWLHDDDDDAQGWADDNGRED